MAHLHPGGGRPELNVGVRPEIREALGTFAILRSGAAVHVAPSTPKRASWASRPGQVEKSDRIAADRKIVVRESREDDLVQQIEAAMAGGEAVNGYVGFMRTATGIKAVPYHGKPFVAKDVRMLARLIDRELVSFDALELLGLKSAPKPQAAPMPKKAKKWVKLTLADLRG